MTAETYLRQAREKRDAVMNANRDLERLLEFQKMTENMEGAVAGPLRRKINRQSLRLRKLIDDCIEFDALVHRQISDLVTPREHQKPKFEKVLLGMYLYDKTIPEIAGEMYYSEFYTSQMHRSALETFARQYGLDSEYCPYMDRNFGLKPER